MKNNYFVQAWLVLALALVFGAALASVDSSLKDRIAENKLNETIQQIPSLVPGATGGQEVLVNERGVYRATDEAGEQVGWVVPASGQGFAGPIELLIGLGSQAETITGLYVLAQTETPALGDNIKKDDFRGQFADKTTGEAVKVVKTAPAPGTNEIQALSGATVSSESVARIVNETVSTMRESLAAAAGGQLPAASSVDEAPGAPSPAEPQSTVE